MSFERIETPQVRLYNLTLGFLKSFDMSVDQTAGSLVAAISDDPAALVELVGKDRLIAIAQEYAQRLYDEDIRGGGIGLRPADKTGGDAAADETGQVCADTRKPGARSSAPKTQTPAAMPVGGGQLTSDAQWRPASPTSPASANRVTVSEYPQPVRKPEPVNVPWSPADIGAVKKAEPKIPWKAPKERVSAHAQARMKNEIADTVLDTVKVRGLPIGDWISDKALEAADGMESDSRILRAFATGVPPGRRIRDFITRVEAENIMKKLEANRAA